VLTSKQTGLNGIARIDNDGDIWNPGPGLG